MGSALSQSGSRPVRAQQAERSRLPLEKPRLERSGRSCRRQHQQQAGCSEDKGQYDSRQNHCSGDNGG
jgi:hypothetical protein